MSDAPPPGLSLPGLPPPDVPLPGGERMPGRPTDRATPVPRTTYRLYIGGAFARAASGRTFPVYGTDGAFLANAALAADRDAREAVVAARGAFPAWSRASGYERSQALYRVAEVMAAH